MNECAGYNLVSFSSMCDVHKKSNESIIMYNAENRFVKPNRLHWKKIKINRFA